jgi:predicted RNase H-like nuclease
MAVVGADGCKAGWFAIRRENDGRSSCQVFRTIADLWDGCRDADLILVDIPIGLPDATQRERRCDSEARTVLGPRRSSVFTPPGRAALAAATYEDGSEANLREVGRRLSRQAWGIVPKIKEVDELLRTNLDARSKIREVHPEVCFWAFNGGAPMGHPKKSPEGGDERMGLLTQASPQVKAIVAEALRRFLRKDVAPDDILDALAATLTAECAVSELAALPSVSQTDAFSMPMEMVYCPTRPNDR